MTVTSLYFELSEHDRYHLADWEERLGSWLSSLKEKIVTRASRPDDAEFIIDVSSRHSLLGADVFTPKKSSHYTRRPDTTFLWDSGDHPTGLLPGLFCSLHKRLAQPSRHRGFCYPLRMNPLVTALSPDDARYLFGFSGNITAPLRAKLFQTFAAEARAGRALMRKTESIFHRIYDPASDVERRRYVEDIAQCRFVLCPRGNGLASIRLFETMEAGRVPVIISDAHHLPECVDWNACSIRVSERNLAQIPTILAGEDARWRQLAHNARQEWSRCFSNPSLLPTLVSQIRNIVAARRLPESAERRRSAIRIVPHYATARAKKLIRSAQQKFR
jgi:hypothetical protein